MATVLVYLVTPIFLVHGLDWLPLENNQCYSSTTELQSFVNKNQILLLRYKRKIATLENEITATFTTNETEVIRQNTQRMVEIQNETLHSLRTKMQQTTKQRRLLQKLYEQMKSIKQNMSKLEDVISARAGEQLQRQQNVELLLSQIKTIQKNNTYLQRLIIRESSLQESAGFTVQIDSPVTLQDRNRLVFGTIVYRSDDGFDVSDSVLTSIYSGVYLLHITVCSQGPNQIARAVVCKNYNHRWVSFAYAEDSWNSTCGSNTVVVEARKGDKFWVRSHQKSYIATGSRFSGTLIYRTG